MTNVIEKIEGAGYLATDAQVEALAHTQYAVNVEHTHADSVYLRIVLREVQAKLGALTKGRRPPATTQARAVNEASVRLYAAVLRGVTTEEVAPSPDLDAAESHRRAVERNRRTVFARTAKATLLKYAREGGDLRRLELATVTKGGIRALMSPAESTNRTERTISRSQAALVRALARQAKTDPLGAKDAANMVIAALRKALGRPEPMKVGRRNRVVRSNLERSPPLNG